MRRKNQKIAFLIDNIPVHIVLDKTQEKLNSIDINVYNNVQDGIMEELVDYTIYDAFQNIAKKEEQVVDKNEFMLILEKINPIEVEIAIDKTIRFLYEQEPEF
ncbi:11263_t:CDS:2, partial [Rhizophagus irregularis]